MSLMVTELYDALRKAGVDERLARDAARSVLGTDARTDLATKADIAELRLATKADITEVRLATKADITEVRLATKADLAELKVEMIKWNVGAMAVLTAIFAAISRLG